MSIGPTERQPSLSKVCSSVDKDAAGASPKPGRGVAKRRCGRFLYGICQLVIVNVDIQSREAAALDTYSSPPTRPDTVIVGGGALFGPIGKPEPAAPPFLAGHLASVSDEAFKHWAIGVHLRVVRKDGQQIVPKPCFSVICEARAFGWKIGSGGCGGGTRKSGGDHGCDPAQAASYRAGGRVR